MEILNVLKKRYATKKFDPNRKLTEEQISQLEDILRLSPSSINVQPWHFIVATTDEAKKKIAKSTDGGVFSFNTQRILDSGAVIVFSHKIDINNDYVNHIVDTEDKDGRFLDEETKARTREAYTAFAGKHRDVLNDFKQWSEKQLYINLGNFALSAAALGLDTLIMEGFDSKIIDQEFNLNEKGFASSVLVAVGYSAEDDFNKNLPKSRLPKDEIIERV